jgi:hypothetical protein
LRGADQHYRRAIGHVGERGSRSRLSKFCIDIGGTQSSSAASQERFSPTPLRRLRSVAATQSGTRSAFPQSLLEIGNEGARRWLGARPPADSACISTEPMSQSGRTWTREPLLSSRRMAAAVAITIPMPAAAAVNAPSRAGILSRPSIRTETAVPPSGDYLSANGMSPQRERENVSDGPCNPTMNRILVLCAMSLVLSASVDSTPP